MCFLSHSMIEDLCHGPRAGADNTSLQRWEWRSAQAVGTITMPAGFWWAQPNMMAQGASSCSVESSCSSIEQCKCALSIDPWPWTLTMRRLAMGNVHCL